MIEEIKKAVITILVLSVVGGVLLGISLSTPDAVNFLFVLPSVIICTYIITDLFHTLDDLEMKLYK